MRTRRTGFVSTLVVVVVVATTVLFRVAAVSLTATPLSLVRTSTSSRTACLVLRGGADGVRSTKSSSSNKTKKKKKKKTKTSTTTTTTTTTTTDGKNAINSAMKETDAAEALGKAIRDRRDVLRNDPVVNATAIDRVDGSLLSLAASLGASDWRRHDEDDDLDGGGGVGASRTSVLANYFLQSHGGAYAFQCAASVLSVGTGLAALWTTSSSTTVFLVLLRRCLLCALAKHASGLLTAALLSARRIREIGLHRTRRRIEALAADPVAQYVFYCAFSLVWLPRADVLRERSSSSSLPWYLETPVRRRSTATILAGPVLLREIVHCAWVVDDASVILGDGDDDGDGALLPRLLGVFRAAVDAVGSLLASPDEWRDSDGVARQRVLARAVSRASASCELATGALVVGDAVRDAAAFVFASRRPPLAGVVARATAAELYVNFLLARRRKISDLVHTLVRGGALAALPGRVLDALSEPRRATGVGVDEPSGGRRERRRRRERRDWIDVVGDALGIVG